MAATSVNDTAEPYAAYIAAASGGVFGEKTPIICSTCGDLNEIRNCIAINDCWRAW